MTDPRVEEILLRKPRKGTRVLSLYLQTGAAGPQGAKRRFEGAFRRMVRTLGRGLSEAERQELARDALRPWGFLLAYRPHAPSVALFCDESEGLFWTREFSVVLPEEARWEEQPYTRPLLDALDEHGRCAVALVDRKRARLFLCRLGEIEERTVFESSPAAKRTRHPGMDRQRSQGRLQHAANDHVRQNLRMSVDRLRRWAREKDFKRLFLGGPSDTTGELRRLLPGGLRKLADEPHHLPTGAGEREILRAAHDWGEGRSLS